MYRLLLCMAAALLAFGFASAPALADDYQTCDRGTGEASIAACSRLIQKDKGNAAAYSNRGLRYNEMGDYGRAIPDFDQAIRLDPKNKHAFNNRCWAYNGKGEFDRALSDCDQAITLDSKNAVAYLNRGNAYLGKHDYVRAISDYDQAIRLDPKPVVAYGNRGKVHEDKGDYARAIADYGEALKIDPNYAFARQGRERVQAALTVRPNPPPFQPAPPAPPAVAERRIALVIGMSAYANVAPLPNPVRDARAVAATFRRLGFAEVVELEDLTRANMEAALKEFGDKAAAADWAVIYYAGHGVEMQGRNYLVPVDAMLAQADHVEDEALSLSRVLSKATPARKLRMVIIDACRNNPFRLASAQGGKRAVSRGLAPIEPKGGVLVAYAARGGTMADDGAGDHSPFTQALLTHLETPGLDIGIMFRRVRDSVLATTNNTQEPFTYGSLPGQEFYFKEAAR